ncbi:MAG: heavy metal-responsive transcriptional regulator [Gemmatimonadales bacterium]
MRIGEVATEAAVGVQTLRYYERRGLLPKPRRHASGQRAYVPDVVQRVRFIKRAQDLGFTLDEIGGLLALWTDSIKSCKQVEHRAAATLDRIQSKIDDLEQMRDALTQYVNACQQRRSLEECPILRALGGAETETE